MSNRPSPPTTLQDKGTFGIFGEAFIFAPCFTLLMAVVGWVVVELRSVSPPPNAELGFVLFQWYMPTGLVTIGIAFYMIPTSLLVRDLLSSDEPSGNKISGGFAHGKAAKLVVDSKSEACDSTEDESTDASSDTS